MKIVKFYTLLLATALSSAVYAGPKISTRADVIVLPDDSVVLADPFIDAVATQEGGGPLLQLLNPRIYQTIALYKKVSLTAAFVSNDASAMFDRLLNKRTDLRFYGLNSAEEMNRYCFGGKPVYTIPSGASVQQVACTKGTDTFIVKPLFLKLSIRDQAMLLIHERLTTITDDRGWINFVAVARYTNGLNTFLKIYDEQARREYRELTDLEKDNLYNYYIALLEIQNRNADYGNISTFNWKVHKNGGGLVHVGAFVDPTAFVSLNSVVTDKSEIKTDAKVINLMFRGDNDARYAPALILGENTTINNLDLYNVKKVLVGVNTTITNTVVDSEQVNAGDNVLVGDSWIAAKTITLKNGVNVKRSQIAYQGKDLLIADNEQVSDQVIKAEFADMYYPAGVIPKPFSLTVKVPLFKCVTDTKAEKKSWQWSESAIDNNGDGSTTTGWITYNGRNGLKKEYEYNYSDTKVDINIKNNDRTKTPVMFIDEKGKFVNGDYLKKNKSLSVKGFDECSYSAISEAMVKAGLPRDGYGNFIIPSLY